ncbi:MAG: aldolase/citrate lyase family protein, partial [Alphaproteobacteria bacterium]|nr:aldolase/citrate lyase family protein [Alphaproteobacteria bacterium]
LLWIGHFDLSCSLGVPGAFDHPDFIAAHKRIVAAAHAAGKSIGRLVGSPEDGRRLIGEGVDFICYGTDASLLLQAARAGFASMRA